MLEGLVANWRKGGKTSRPNAPERISPKHAAILVTRAADQMTEAQEHLFDPISGQCPDVIDLRQMALAFRTALTVTLPNCGQCEYGPVVRFRLRIEKGPVGGVSGRGVMSTGQVEGQINRLK